ncbi:MAG TPA: hypothetical protein VFR52_06885 [Sphingomicrobium sp.]|nr:hypothetical protein [Sphingomicrobium sp.]
MSIVAYAFAALLAGQAAEPTPAAPPAPAAAEPTLDQVRAATERFRDVKVAVAEGYIRDPMDHCVVATDIGRPAADGAMGVHYIRMDLLGVSGPPNPRVSGTGVHTDFNKPSVLLYEPKADGSLELIGVENLVFKAAWEEAGNKQPPTYQGVDWNLMQDDPATPVDEGHMFVPHYDRHVWLYRENPKGIYEQFNPNVSCAAHKPVHVHDAAAQAESGESHQH